jgi:acyl phosphate:glycerol-3-phosphate acyltransferase
VTLALGILCYLIGSIPSGYLLYRSSEKADIRKFGSGATGATNVLRLKGWRAALPVALMDVSKGFLPSFAILRLLHDPVLAAGCASLAVLGHCYPVYIGFRGGKGVATAAGAMFAIAPLAACGSLVVFAAAVALTRFVSLGSILAVLLFPPFMLLFGLPRSVIFMSLPILILILVRHGGNIGRLLHGTERKLGRRETPAS